MGDLTTRSGPEPKESRAEVGGRKQTQNATGSGMSGSRVHNIVCLSAAEDSVSLTARASGSRVHAISPPRRAHPGTRAADIVCLTAAEDSVSLTARAF